MDTTNNFNKSNIDEEGSNAEPAIKQGWLRALIYFFCFFIVSTLFALIGTAIIAIVKGGGLSSLELDIDNPKYQLIIQFSALIGTLFTTYLFRKFIDKKTFHSMGFQWKGYKKPAFDGFLLGLVLIVLGFTILILLKNLAIIELNFSWSVLFIYFLLLTVVSLNEEIALRGYILNNLMESLNKYWALLISALAFCFHTFRQPECNLGCSSEHLFSRHSVRDLLYL